MEYVIGILLLVSFFGLVVYAVRGGNLMLGIFVMGIIWTVLPMIGNMFVTNPDFIAANKDAISISWTDALQKVFQSGPEGWGPVLVNVVFGAWFGRVLMKTGIASTLIRTTTELGGDKPAITCILLCIVTTACFSSIFGAGAVVAIGVIVLPIFMSLGIPKVLATCSFMLSVGAGMFVNPVLYGQYSAFFLGEDGKTLYPYEQHVSWGIYALLIQVAVVIIMVVVLSREKKVHSWAATAPSSTKKRRGDNAPGIALIAPIIPVVLLIVLKVPIILGFIIGSFYALFTCGKIKSWGQTCRMVNKDFFDGVVDTAPLVGFLLKQSSRALRTIFQRTARWNHSEQYTDHQYRICSTCTTWNVPRTIHTVWMWSCNTWHLKRYRILNRISCTADHHPKYSNERILLYHSVLDRMGC